MWHPPSGASVVGHDVFFGGFNGTGAQSITSSLGNHLIGNRTPSGALQGDSGGGAFVVLTDQMAGSVPVGIPCATVEMGSVGDLVLVGINQSFVETEGQDVEDRFVRVYASSVLDWVAHLTSDDRDGDFVCDGVDNCIDVPNDQANCNALMEAGLPGDVVLGDACDPAPCPRPSLEFREFSGGTALVPVPGGGGGTVLVQTGRDISDELAIEPVLGVGVHGPSTAYPRFCQCGVLNPLACEGPPWYCTIDARLLDKTEVGMLVDPPQAIDPLEPTQTGETRWHKVSLLGLGPNGLPEPILGDPVALDGYPGPKTLRRWDFRADFDRWTQLNWLFPEPPPDVGVPAGTDLRGVMWAHSPITQGATDHGLECFTGDPGVVCSLADGFMMVAPDAPARGSWGYELPQTAPPVFAFCDVCGDSFRLPGDEPDRAAPFVTRRVGTQAASYWLADRGGRDATPFLSSDLVTSIDSPLVRWVTSSEPMNVASYIDASTAILLSSAWDSGVGARHGTRRNALASRDEPERKLGAAHLML
jgi:hypothetical protein